MKNYILKIKNRSKTILVCTILSLFISITSFLLCIICSYTWYGKLASVLFLIPTIILFLLNYFSIKKSFKDNILKNIIIFSNIFIVFVVQIVAGFIFLTVIQLIDGAKQYTNPKEYSIALKSISAKERVKHFPKKIPENAKNIVLDKCSNPLFGSEEIYLKFYVDKQYIEEQIKRNKYISIEKPNEYKHDFDKSMLWNNKSNNYDKFKFYVISDRENENLSGHYFPYHYGIGVNTKYNEIIFYYICPD